MPMALSFLPSTPLTANGLQSYEVIHDLSYIGFSRTLLLQMSKKDILVCLYNRQRRIDDNAPIFIYCSRCDICQCSHPLPPPNVKHLGNICYSDGAVISDFENTLRRSWGSQQSMPCNKLRGVSFTIYKSRFILPLPVYNIIAHALGYIIFRYGITLFFHCCFTCCAKIHVLGTNITFAIYLFLCPLLFTSFHRQSPSSCI